MTAYQLTPVGPEGRQEERTEEIELLSYNELLDELRKARADAEVWHNAWATLVNARIADRHRLSRAMRVLASIGRLNPFAAALVERGRAEVYGELP